MAKTILSGHKCQDVNPLISRTAVEDVDAMERGSAPRSEPDPDHREEVIREQEGSGDDLEEPLLVQAHRMNHSTEAEETNGRP